MQIDQLSQKLLKNEHFINEIKNTFQKFYQQKNIRQTQEQNSMGNFNTQALELAGIADIQQNQDIFVRESRYSVSSSVFSKKLSRQSNSSVTSNPMNHQFLQSRSSFGNLNQITNEIASTLSEIIRKECLLNASSTSRSPQPEYGITEAIQMMQTIQKQQINSLKEDLEQRIASYRTQIQDRVMSMIQGVKHERKNRKSNQKLTAIRKERKKVTQSILDMSRNNNQISAFSNIHDIRNTLSDSEQQECSQSVRSSQLSQLSQKIDSVWKSQRKIGKQFQQKFAKEVKQNTKDIYTLAQRIIQWKIKNQQNLQNCFTGVWNIVAEIQDKINKVCLRLDELQHALSFKN